MIYIITFDTEEAWKQEFQRETKLKHSFKRIYLLKLV